MSSENDSKQPLPTTEPVLSLELLAAQIAGLREREEQRMLETKPLNETLQAIHAVLFQINDRLDSLERRFEERMDRLEERITRLEERMDRIEERMDRIEERVDRIEQRLDVIEERLGHIETDIRDIRSEHNNIRRGITASQTMVLDELRELDKRVTRLEQALNSPSN
jgi:chromosome segregation ATPase